MHNRGDRPENAVASEVVDAALHIHMALGPGLLESAYEVLLARELAKRGMQVRTQVPVPLEYEGEVLEVGFRADLIVDGCVLVELKSVEELAPVHFKQVLTYLKVSGLRLGLLLNFGAGLMKDGVYRIVNNLPDS